MPHFLKGLSKRHMKVAFDAQLLFEKQKTGIGWNAKMMIDQLVTCPEIECILNCFRLRDQYLANQILSEYQEKGCTINQSRWMPGRIYNHLDRIIPFPYRWVFGNQADITQFFNYTIPYGVTGKKVTTVHDMAFLAYPETVAKRTRRWLGKNLRKYCCRADVIITVSEFSKQEICRYMDVPLEKIEVIYNGVDLVHYRPRGQEEIQEVQKRLNIPGKYILYLGTLEPRKNIENLIRAYRILKKGMTYAPRLVLAGKKGWMYDSIFELIKDYGLVHDVVFTGYVDETDVPALLSGAEMFVFPSLYEGFGIPPLEAMACGTPVITSDTSSLPEVVGDAGIMVPPYDVDALFRAMISLLEDTEQKERLVSEGYKQAARFTWEASARKMFEVYKKIGDGRYQRTL